LKQKEDWKKGVIGEDGIFKECFMQILVFFIGLACCLNRAFFIQKKDTNLVLQSSEKGDVFLAPIDLDHYKSRSQLWWYHPRKHTLVNMLYRTFLGCDGKYVAASFERDDWVSEKKWYIEGNYIRNGNRYLKARRNNSLKLSSRKKTMWEMIYLESDEKDPSDYEDNRIFLESGMVIYFSETAIIVYIAILSSLILTISFYQWKKAKRIK
jgi:hypothetical protein